MPQQKTDNLTVLKIIQICSQQQLVNQILKNIFKNLSTLSALFKFYLSCTILLVHFILFEFQINIYTKIICLGKPRPAFDGIFPLHLLK